MMKPKLNVLKLKNFAIFEQLQLEEALLRADDSNWFIYNEGSPRAIVMGISGKPEELIDPATYAADPVPVIKRFSGGGTVFVDHNTLFATLIGQKAILDVPCFPKELLCWTKQFYAGVADDFCIQENDYVIGDRKFGGNAQYLCKERWLHHTSLLWDFSMENMQYLQLPARRPAYREDRPHNDFLCTLKDYLPSREAVQELLFANLAHTFDLTGVPFEEVLPILDRPHRKATQGVGFSPEASVEICTQE